MAKQDNNLESTTNQKESRFPDIQDVPVYQTSETGHGGQKSSTRQLKTPALVVFVVRESCGWS